MRIPGHLTADDLVLHHYGETGDSGAIQHLVACDGCRAEYEELRRALASVEAAPVPERDEEYGAAVWQRLRPRLARRRVLPWSPLLRPGRWAVAATLTMMLMASFLAGRFWPGPQPWAAGPISEQVRERILLIALGDHLERSQMMLIELTNAPAAGEAVDLSARRREAHDLASANRIFRRTAASAGEAMLASALEELERILLDIAHTPERISSLDLREMQRRIQEKGILFKVRVIGSQVRQRERATSQRRI